MLSTSTILGIINWCLVYMAILIYLLIFFIVFKSRRELREISLLLTFHTCIYAFLICMTVCIMVSSNLFSEFLLNNMTFCNLWSLFYDIFECSIYYSYCLQGFYRLCHIVFYKKKFLLSHRLYIILIIVQCIVVLALLLPPVFINWYAHLPTEKYCLILYTHIGSEIYHILLLYLVPLISLSIIYIWITKYMRHVSQASTLTITANQRIRNQRDLVVIKRIIILISILIILRFPTIIFMIYGVIVGSLYPLTYGIVGLITTICLILIGTTTIYMTTQLRNYVLNFFLQQNNRVQNEPIPLNQVDNTIRKVDDGTFTQRSKKRKDFSLE